MTINPKILYAVVFVTSVVFASNVEGEPSLGEDTQDTVVRETAAKAIDSVPPGYPAFLSQDEDVVWLPSLRPFPSLVSDPRDPKIGILYTNSKSLEARIGGYRSILGFKHGFLFGETVSHFGVDGAVYFQLRHDDSRFPTESSDGYFGLYLEGSSDNFLYQLRFGHISAHLGDGLFGERQPIRYSREFFSLRIAQQWEFFRPYIGAEWLVHTVPDLPRWAFQAGFYAVLPIWFWRTFKPYVGFDYRAEDEFNIDTLTTTTGFMLVSDTEAPPIRLTIRYITGKDPRGQFFNDNLDRWAVGLEFDH